MVFCPILTRTHLRVAITVVVNAFRRVLRNCTQFLGLEQSGATVRPVCPASPAKLRHHATSCSAAFPHTVVSSKEIWLPHGARRPHPSSVRCVRPGSDRRTPCR